MRDAPFPPLFRPIQWLSFALLVTLPPSFALAGDVEGKLEEIDKLALVRDTSKAFKGAYLLPQPNGLIPVRPLKPAPHTRLAVVLTGRPGSAAAHMSCTLRLHGATFFPATFVGPANAAIELENRDSLTHHVYGENLDSLKPEPTEPGRTRSFKVDKAGHWLLKDQLYHHITGHLHIRDDVTQCSSVNRRGSFSFRDVPAGTYVLRVFFREHELLKQKIRVEEKDTTKVDPIVLPTPPPSSAPKPKQGT